MDYRLPIAALVIGGLVLWAKSKATATPTSSSTSSSTTVEPVTVEPWETVPNGATVSTPISDRPQIPSTDVIAFYRNEDGTKIVKLLAYIPRYAPDGTRIASDVKIQESDGTIKTMTSAEFARYAAEHGLYRA